MNDYQEQMAPIAGYSPNKLIKGAIMNDPENVNIETGEVIETLPAVIEQKSAIANWQGIAQEPFDKKTAQALEAKIPDEVIEIRPDGMIYLPQTEYRRILNKAFGVGAWALRRLDIKVKDQTVIFDGELWANGRYIAGAMGEQDYIESNKNMSWATAVESAKSDCLTRCCKDIGIAIDLWNPRFVKAWKEQFAVEVWCEHKKNPDQKKLFWRKKTDSPIDGWPWKETGQKQPSQKQSAPPKSADTPPPAPPKSSPQYAEKKRIDFVGYVEKVLEEQISVGMNADFKKGLLIADKTPAHKLVLIKWFLYYMCAGDKTKYGDMLLQWSTGRGHAGFGFLEIDRVEEKEIEFTYERAKKAFREWVKVLDGGEPVGTPEPEEAQQDVPF